MVEELADEAGARERKERKAEGEAVPLPAPQLCIVAAHDEADHIAASMLARLLAPEHVQTLLLPRNILAAEVIQHVTGSDAKAVCISAVPPQAASNAAYLVKRLRQHAPQMKVVVALWCGDESVESTARRLRGAGADEVACRLPEALEKIRLVAPPGAA